MEQWHPFQQLTPLPGGMAAAVTTDLPPGAVLFGFSAEAVAVAVRRAFAKATSWSDHQWDITERYNALPSQLTGVELAAACTLAATKFSTDEWLHRVP